MQPVIYDVAVSIDGFISGPGGDISQFPNDQKVIDDYRIRLSDYACAIMGRATYEFGYRFGLEPGANPYPNMETFVFSKTLEVPDDSSIRVVREEFRSVVHELKQTTSGPIYLCGGGKFAGAMLATGQIDILRLKRAPIILGDGTRLFDGEIATPTLRYTSSKNYDGGYLLQQYDVIGA